MNTKTIAVLVAAASLLSSGPVRAQQEETWDPRQVYMSRAELRSLFERFELAANSAAYSQYLRDQSRFEADLVRLRLEEGDFQVGDRILLRVQGEATLTDTFTVTEGRVLALQDIGQVPLQGVLRSELEQYVTDFLARFIRTPRAQARSLIPVTIVGGVTNPGFYTVPSQLRLDDALMIAGGPTALAQLDRLRIERAGRRIWEGAPLQQAIVDGRTLDQLNIRGGDQIHLPAAGGTIGAWESSVRTISYLLAIPISLFAIITLFGGGSDTGGG
ncbi:MAG: SLBB domain-containing protein [Gemmatimonadota bacterium]|nr:MAG: SLBB domain-containing protein [Gemmatimonadota bacterium]